MQTISEDNNNNEEGKVVGTGEKFIAYLEAKLEKIIPMFIESRAEYDKKLKAWYRDSRDIKLEKLLPFIGCSNFSVPVSSSAVDAIIPRMVEGVFDHEPPVQVKAVNTQSKEYKEVMQNFVDWDLASHEEIKNMLWLAIQETVVLGTGFVETIMDKEKESVDEEIRAYVIAGEQQPYLDNETGTPLAVTKENTAKYFTQRQNPEFNPETMPSEMQFLPPVKFTIKEFVQKENRWKYYEPKHNVVSIFDVLFNPDASSMLDVWDNGILVLRQHATKDYLKRMLKQDDKQLYNRLNKKQINEFETKQFEFDKEKDNSNLNLNEKSQKVEYFKVFMFEDIDNDGIDEKIVVLYSLKERTVFGWEKFPYKHNKCPVTPLYIHPIAGKVFGIGICEKLFDSKGEIDFIHNSRNDRLALANDPILVTTARTGFNNSIHKRGFGRTWILNDASYESIHYLEAPKNEGDSYQSEEMTKNWAERVSSVDGRAVGVQNQKDSNSTASGIQAVINEGNTKFRHYIRWLSTGIKCILEQRYSLIKQYWGDEADDEVDSWVQQILDIPENPLRGELQSENGISVGDRFEAIKQSFNLIMTASYVDKEQEYKKNMSAWQIVMSEPLYEQDPQAKLNLLRDIYRTLGFKNPEEILPNMERIQQMMVEAQKEAQRQLMEEEAQAREEQSFNEEKLKEMGALEASEGLRLIPQSNKGEK